MARRCVLGAIAALFLIAAALTACGSIGEAPEDPAPSSTPAATLAAATSTPAPTPTLQTSGAKMAMVGGDDEMGADLFQLGERIFQKDAGEGVGCSFCHGADAKGSIGPNIRGKTPDDIRGALARVDAMSFLRLNQKKIEAVSEYLKWLATQP